VANPANPLDNIGGGPRSGFVFNGSSASPQGHPAREKIDRKDWYFSEHPLRSLNA
jgi:hypothetical protein